MPISSVRPRYCRVRGLRAVANSSVALKDIMAFNKFIVEIKGCAMSNQQPQKTIVIWRRFGKEHGEGQGFQVNPPEVVAAHIQNKLEQNRQTPDSNWRWWQLSEDVIIERGLGVYPGASPGTYSGEIIYYLPRKNLALMWRPGYINSGREWTWYVHIGETQFDDHYGCWIFKDLFADVLIADDNITHGVYDLDDIAHALEIGLIDAQQVISILRTTQSIVDTIRSGEFPIKEVIEYECELKELGLNRAGK